MLRRVAVAVVCFSASLGASPASGYAAPAAPAAASAPVAPAPAAQAAAAEPQFGPNVTVFDPSMTTSEIQAKADAIRDLQINDEMGTARYSLMFKPGTYGSAAQPLIIQVGYYTEVVGLGRNPTDVTITGHVDVYNRCRPISGCIALDNFWRSMSNLTIKVTGGQGCRADTNFWAASQASPMRRVNIIGKLTLMDYCTDGPQYASGGFISDSRTGEVINGSQQQYFVRNSTIGSWSNGVWNQVFSGVVGAPPECFPGVKDGCGPYTTLGETPASREKPYLYLDSAGRYNVFAPYATTRSAGVSWANGTTPGRSIPLARFFVAKPSDSAQAINSQLSRGMNLLLTPGVYDIDKTLMVTHANAVVLGMGMATLTSAQGATVMKVGDVNGVDIAGITFDAGPTSSRVLLQIGKPTAPGARGSGSKSNPTALQDVFFRIGGPHVGKADVSLEVNSNSVILDDIWAWRADHGNAGTVGWTVNTAKTGVVVNGDDVTATGFFVEHYQQHNVVWNGNGGTIVFFQNELAYDPPSQAAWKESRRVNGWSALKVADSVKTFRAYGMGSYSFFNQGVDIFAENAYEVPATLAPGSLHNLLTIFLDPLKGSGGITHVVNGVGGSSTVANPGTPVTVVDYPAVPDTTPPTLAITDDVPGATAKGDVTFTFTFSEDVGTSFTADDVALTGGTAGTFTRVDATHATLVASPGTDSTGTLQVTVATGAFTDLAGNANPVGATAQQAYDTTTTPPGAFVISFDETTPPVLTDFGDNQSSLVADPTNASNTVARVVKLAGAPVYAGTTVSTLANQAVPVIPFTATTTTMTARVWSPDAGTVIRLKAESSTNPGQSVETEATTTLAGAWETLTFDFAHQASGTAALDPSLTYDKVSVFFAFGTVGSGKTYYLDDLTWPGSGATPPPPSDLLITFDEATPPVLTGFEGADGAVVADPTNPANLVGRAVKSATAAFYAGTTISTLTNADPTVLAVPTIPLTATRAKITMKVYSPAVGARVRMKVENATNPGINCETDAFTTVAGAFETLAFDFNDPSTHYIPNGPGPSGYDLTKPTAPLNAANTYNKVSVFYDYGVGGSGYAPLTGAETWYFDDLSY